MRGPARASAKNATLTPSQLATVTETAIEIETETEIETVIETAIAIVLSGPHPRCVQAPLPSGEATAAYTLLTRVFPMPNLLGIHLIIASSPDNGPDHDQAALSVLLALTGPEGRAHHHRHLDETTTGRCGNETENETATETVIVTAATSATATVAAGVVLLALTLTLLGTATGSTATATGTENATSDGFVKTATVTTEIATICAPHARHLTSAIAVDVHRPLGLDVATTGHL